MGEEQRTGGGYRTPEWLSTLVVADIVHPSLKAHILCGDHISVERDLTVFCSLLQMGQTLEMSLNHHIGQVMHVFIRHEY